MAKLYLVVVISLLFSLANGQKFQLLPKQTPLEGVLGGNLTMTWEMVNVPDGKGFLAADLYMDFDQKKLLLEGRTNPARQNYATERFGNRISANITVSPPKYEVTLTKLQYNDAGSFSLKVVIDDDGPPQDTKVITISRIKDPKKPGGGDPKKPGGGDPKKPGVGDPEEGSNTGAIVGGVIGGIVCVALIVLGVLYFLRWKKNRGSSEETTKKLNSGNQTYEAPQYADTSVALGNDRQAPAKEYLELGPGGGRVGERTNLPPQSHYREVKNLDDDDEEPPQKPERGVFRQDSDGNTISDNINV